MKARVPDLQGLVTNDVAPLEDQHARPMYACILNAQGRFLHDLFMHRQPGQGALLLRFSMRQPLHSVDAR
jgi:folate-binding Fe-S cluster repair protein YgfZ